MAVVLQAEVMAPSNGETRAAERAPERRQALVCDRQRGRPRDAVPMAMYAANRAKLCALLRVGEPGENRYSHIVCFVFFRLC